MNKKIEQLFNHIIEMTSGGFSGFTPEKVVSVNTQGPDPFIDNQAVYDKFNLQPLKEMSSPKAIELAKTFCGILRGKTGIKTEADLSFDKLKTAMKITVAKFGSGSKEALNFNFSPEEELSENPKETYIHNFALAVQNNIGFLAKQIISFIEDLKHIFRSAINDRGIFR